MQVVVRGYDLLLVVFYELICVSILDCWKNVLDVQNHQLGTFLFLQCTIYTALYLPAERGM